MPNKTEKFFDIYLWTIPENNKLIKVEHLTYEEATQLTAKWFNCDEPHDYMIVLEGSTPFVSNPFIEVKTKEWLESI